MDRALEGCRLLLVEDEAAILLDLQRLLQDAGCTIVRSATKLQSALESAAEASIDLALLDINLHGEKVFPVADALVARGIPFVFLTGYDSTVLPERFGQRPTCRKPYTPKRLLAVLGSAAGR
jgi:CheY-like chemotaxis protein